MYYILFLFQVGGTYAKPVLFPPQVAIGAIGRIQVCICELIKQNDILLLHSKRYVLQKTPLELDMSF